jgi:hypothetical protein
MYKTENHDVKESDRNQELKGIKPKTEIEWNQMETMIWGNVSNRNPEQNGIKPKPKNGERYQIENRN